ncbi:AAA family ATPase [Acinetobacter lwoffii]|uniref:AAA family ATPase n=1 Tax=Acinetobacter lwoffii TaxID=28090 RepID=UPI00110CAADD|nr:AAA family ATPase [Acinetobacter lwoffii]TMS45869.1 hypothetical protein FGQ54_10525 [Acinetobacter lwoffii]
MLKNIEIKNFGSYVSFNGLEEKYCFKKMNILYGANYSGKTTLSRIVALLKNKDNPEKYFNPNFNLIFENEVININNYKDNNKELLVFNKDFISENLSFLVLNNHQSGSIKGFDAVIVGQDQIAINNKISELNTIDEMFTYVEEGVNLVLDEINKERTNLNFEKLALERDIGSKLTEKARKLEASGLKNTARTYRRPNLESDIDLILRKNPQLVRSFTDDEIVKKIKDMSVSQKPIINVINKELEIRNIIEEHIKISNKKLKEIVEKTVTKEMDEFFKEWSLKGYTLHKEHNKDHCEFCGGELKESIWKEYELFLNKKEEVLSQQINDLIESQTRISRALKTRIEELVDPDIYFYDSFKNKYIELLECLKLRAFEFTEVLSALEDKLKEKLNCLYEEVFFDFVHLEKSVDALIVLYVQVVDISNKNDEFSTNIGGEQTKLKLEVLEDQIIEFLVEFEWFKKKNKINELDEANGKLSYPEKCNKQRIEEIRNIKLNIENEIKILNTQKSSQVAASELVNKFLNSFFGHESLTLIPLNGEDDQGKFKIIRNGQDAYNLSEGECTLVAFCYFIALVYNLKNIDKLKDHIIYIDDPISSLDSNNIFYIYSLIENVICKEGKYKQLFISTHNLDFFKYLRKLTIPKMAMKSCNEPSCISTKRDKKDDIGFYFIKKNTNSSELTVLPNYLKKYNTEFNYLFSQIWNCANETSEISPDQIYNFGNNMRKFFEVYNYFKYPTDQNKNIFREKFFDAENNMNHFKLVDRIANEYSHAEEIFDRTMRPISSQEMIDAAQFILKRLKANDEVQYNALVQSTKDLREDI